MIVHPGSPGNGTFVRYRYFLYRKCYRCVLSGLAEATVKVRVLEDSLAKATKAIDKSKKAQEVQHLLKENSFLQEKLAFQEQQLGWLLKMLMSRRPVSVHFLNL